MDHDAKQYWGIKCADWPRLADCTKMRRKSLNYDFELAKRSEEMERKLKTDTGKAKFKERKTEIEPVFGDIKQNRGFTAFLCRGKAAALAELGLVCIAHNLVKIFRYLQANPAMAGMTN